MIKNKLLQLPVYLAAILTLFGAQLSWHDSLFPSIATEEACAAPCPNGPGELIGIDVEDTVKDAGEQTVGKILDRLATHVDKRVENRGNILDELRDLDLTDAQAVAGRSQKTRSLEQLIAQGAHDPAKDVYKAGRLRGELKEAEVITEFRNKGIVVKDIEHRFPDSTGKMRDIDAMTNEGGRTVYTETKSGKAGAKYGKFKDQFEEHLILAKKNNGKLRYDVDYIEKETYNTMKSRAAAMGVELEIIVRVR